MSGYWGNRYVENVIQTAKNVNSGEELHTLKTRTADSYFSKFLLFSDDIRYMIYPYPNPTNLF